MTPPVKGQKVSSSETLYRRARLEPEFRCYRRDKKIRPNAFRLRKSEKSLSVDVASLTTKEKGVSDPTSFFLIEITVEGIESVNDKNRSKPEEESFFPELTVEHDPIEDNIAHALIIFDADETNHDLVAKELCRIATVIMPVETKDLEKRTDSPSQGKIDS